MKKKERKGEKEGAQKEKKEKIFLGKYKRKIKSILFAG